MQPVPNRAYKSNQFGEKTSLPGGRKNSEPVMGVQKTAEGKVEAVNYLTGRIATANSPKAAVRQMAKADSDLSTRNNRKQPTVKLNKKETKAALEGQRNNYNAYVAPYEDGEVSKSQWAGVIKDRPELKAQGLKFGKEDKAQRASKKGR